ncbi:MAG: tetratricopeptide repeat protein [Deltaproteobacteria bacterium]|nr:tetratricopeptide repeat protein [Deltaproteobacteria bacterium]
MKPIYQAVALAALWLLAAAVSGEARTPAELTKLFIASYDLMEAGKLDKAQEIYQKILRQDPGNPLALNNLAAIKVKQKKYDEALKNLSQALPRAEGYKVKVNKVCDVEGVCMAFRPLALEYGDQDLEPLVRLNIDMVKAKMGGTGVRE